MNNDDNNLCIISHIFTLYTNNRQPFIQNFCNMTNILNKYIRRKPINVVFLFKI